MVQINIDYQGDLRCRSEHAPSSTALVTDAPTDNHGRGESFSPTDLVATALGTCMITVMGIAARKNGWNIDGAKLVVHKHMTAVPSRRIGRLDVELRMPHALDESTRRELEEIGRNCPVAATLDGNVEMNLEFVWPS